MIKRQILFYCSIFVVSFQAYAQLEGDWYGTISRPNGSQLSVILHVTPKSATYNVTADFPSVNKSGINPEFVNTEENRFDIIVRDPQVAIEVVKNDREELKANATFNGRPIPFTLKRKPDPVNV